MASQLVFIPLGAEIDADDGSDLAPGIEHRAVGAVEIAPAVFGRGIVHGGDALAGLDQRIRHQDLLSELAGVHGVRVQDENIAVLTGLADGVDELNVGVILEDAQLPQGLLIRGRTDVLLRKGADCISVEQGSNRVGEVQHILLDHGLHGGLGLAHHDETEDHIGCKQQQANDHHIARGQTDTTIFFQGINSVLLGARRLPCVLPPELNTAYGK